jgi:uncharacterized protein (TIGR02145 family)
MHIFFQKRTFFKKHIYITEKGLFTLRGVLMFRLVGRVAVALFLVAEVSVADTVVKDNRDGKMYKTFASGELNWFTDNLTFRKTAAFIDDAGVAYYKQLDWNGSCPEGTHVPDIQEWTLFAKDRFTGPRKLSNVKSFAGKTRGFYEGGSSKVQGKEAAYFAVKDMNGVRAMMLDVKRGNARLVSLPDGAIATVRCVIERDFYAEKNVDEKKMELTDTRDGKKYKVEKRDNRLWMVTNLKFSLTSARQCLLEDTTFCKKFGRFYNYNDAKKACPAGWHLPDDAEWRDFQKDREKLNWETIGRGGCKDWDGYCNSELTGHYWSSTSIMKNTGRSWEFRRQAKSIDRTDQNVQKGLYVRCVTELN